MAKNKVPSKWWTERFSVTDSTLAEAEELQEIDDAVPQTRGWTRLEGKEEPKNPISSAIKDGVLPPKGRKDLFRLQSIRKQDTGQLIGFLGLYHGFPKEDILWINTFTLHPNFQGKGYGPELMNGLIDKAQQLGRYKQMRTYVPLKNWPSLRLCVRIGMNIMVRIEGDKVWAENAEAHVMLAKDLEEF